MRGGLDISTPSFSESCQTACPARAAIPLFCVDGKWDAASGLERSWGRFSLRLCGGYTFDSFRPFPRGSREKCTGESQSLGLRSVQN